MARKKEYYNIDKLLTVDAQYYMLLGMRSNGKSYQVKKTVIVDAYKYGKKFGYVKRWSTDITAKKVTQYFDDANISEWTDGNWTGIKAWGGDIFFTVTENGEEVKSESIGGYFALNVRETYKSLVYKDFYNIIYEEFITDKMYLDNEPTSLQHLVSTILRDNNGRVFLVGNTLSRVCPYLCEWSLDNALKQKQGTIDLYHFHNENGSVTNIAVQNCESIATNTSMFFGQASKNILTGEWETKEYPRPPKDGELAYEVLLSYMSFDMIMSLMVNIETGGLYVNVYPYTHKHPLRIKDMRRITNVFDTSPMVTNCLDRRRKPEALMIECLKGGKVTFSDNLTGTDFNHIHENFMFY